VRFYGHHEKSQMPPFLLEYLQETFTLGKMKALWRGPGEAEYPIVLYGEGYGAKIQKGGGAYTSQTKGGGVSFRLFDVLVGAVPTADIKGVWLRRADVEDVAAKLGIKTVPLLRTEAYLNEVVVMAKHPPLISSVAYEEGTEGHPAEGIVAFTAEPLYNNRGQRLMFKLKTEDFAK
ncbi:hypothetical protein LCGC14_3108120, partial [marine sediment metagenome]